VDLVYMPPPWELSERHDLVTGDFLYARLIGDRKAVEARTQTFDQVVLDQSQRLAHWAELLKRLAPQVRETFAFANNHYAGYAIDTIRELILARRSSADIKRAAREEGMVFLRESALNKALAGRTTLQEINKVTFVEVA